MYKIVHTKEGESEESLELFEESLELLKVKLSAIPPDEFEVDLSECDFSYEGKSQEIMEALPEHITSIDFGRTPIIYEFLYLPPNLLSLRAQNTIHLNLSPEYWRTQSKNDDFSLAHLPSTLQSLDLSDSKLGGFTQKDVQNLLDMLPRNLISLNLSNVSLGARHGFKKFIFPPNLKFLSLQNNALWMYSRNLPLFFKGLPHHLESLDLSNNAFHILCALGDHTHVFKHIPRNVRSLALCNIFGQSINPPRKDELLSILKNLPATIQILTLSERNVTNFSLEDLAILGNALPYVTKIIVTNDAGEEINSDKVTALKQAAGKKAVKSEQIKTELLEACPQLPAVLTDLINEYLDEDIRPIQPAIQPTFFLKCMKAVAVFSALLLLAGIICFAVSCPPVAGGVLVGVGLAGLIVSGGSFLWSKKSKDGEQPQSQPGNLPANH